MLLDLVDCEPPVHILDQDSADEISRLRTHIFRHLIGALGDFLVEDSLAVLIEGQVPAKHGKQRDPRGPDIDFYGVVNFACNQLVG